MAARVALGARRRHAELRFVFAALTVAALVGTALPFLVDERRVQSTLIGSIALVLAAPIAVRLARGAFDPFEPITLFAGVWAFMFVVRPIAMIDENAMSLRATYEVSAGMTAALAVGLVGAVAFVTGYELLRLRRSTRPPAAMKGPPPLWLTVTTTGVALTTMSVQTGLDLASAAAASGAYLYLAPLLSVPAILMWVHRGRPVAGLALTAVAATYFLSFGQRAFVLWPIVALTVWWYLKRARRPSGLRLVLVLFVLVLPMFTALSVAREEQISPFAAFRHEEVLNPGMALERVAMGETNAMFAALALQMQTEDAQWSRQPGYELTSTLGTWVPRGLWAGKPVNSPELLYSQFFPGQYKLNKAGTVFTLAGEFYYDSGYLGVAVGLGLAGALSGWLWAWVRSRPRDPWSWALYAPTVVLGLVFYRGGVSLTIGLGLFIYGPLLIARALARPSTASPYTASRRAT